LLAILKKTPGFSAVGAAYPAEDVINKLPALDDYKLGWKARELCRRAQELWDARFGKNEKAPSAPAAPVALSAPKAESASATSSPSNDEANKEYELGHQYYWGIGKKIDYDEAVKHLRIAAEKGNAKAQNLLGQCYSEGYGVSKNEDEAAKWINKSLDAVRALAEQGDAEAQSELGDYYSTITWDDDEDWDDDVDWDFSEANKWYGMAAEQGYSIAQFQRGLYNYYFGIESEAVKWFQMAADQGLASAQNFLGNCYSEGIGVPQNYSEAIKWRRKAADQGHLEAQFNLGECYYNGDGVPQNYTEAAKWYQKAAEQGHLVAQNQIGGF
jgi:TPR repeat protein